MRVLIACEFSGIVRDAFLARGHDAWSCDLLPTERPGPHIRGDVLKVLDGWTTVLFSADCDDDIDFADCFCFGPTQDGIEYCEIDGVLYGRPQDSPGWDLMIAHPPCTYLCSSGLHWNKRTPGRAEKTEEALAFVRALLDADIPKICLENPRGRIGTAIRSADQTIQPHQFGADASKTTCLWLKGLPPLNPTRYVKPRMVEWPKGSGKMCPRWANQTDSNQNRLGPSADRWALRSITYPGIAQAMAEQWG